MTDIFMSLSPEERGRKASVDGFANEHIACGVLMKRYSNVSLVDLPLSPYDIILVFKIGGEETIIRIQSKTATNSVSFTGGSRGGVDRTYKSGIKTYVQSPEHSDCVVGVHFEGDKPELFFVPTLLIVELNQASIVLSKIQRLKNNYEFLEKCKDKHFVLQKAKEYNII